MSKTNYERLDNARGKDRLISFPWPHEEGTATGYIAGLSRKWLVLTNIDDKIRFGGFDCVRVSHIRHLTTKPKHRGFIETALRLKQETRPADPLTDPTTTASLLQSANEQYPLLVVHRERKSPGTCLIGQIKSIRSGKLKLRCIAPGAVWDKNKSIRLKHITRISFANGYETALHMVGGEPPRD